MDDMLFNGKRNFIIFQKPFETPLEYLRNKLSTIFFSKAFFFFFLPIWPSGHTLLFINLPLNLPSLSEYGEKNNLIYTVHCQADLTVFRKKRQNQHNLYCGKNITIQTKQTFPYILNIFVLPLSILFFLFLFYFFFLLTLSSPCVSIQSASQPRSSESYTYQIPMPASPGPPLLSTSSRGGEARLKSPLSLPSDCLSLSSARRFLLLQMDDWSG